jgi:hypothetical protein
MKSARLITLSSAPDPAGRRRRVHLPMNNLARAGWMKGEGDGAQRRNWSVDRERTIQLEKGLDRLQASNQKLEAFSYSVLP